MKVEIVRHIFHVFLNWTGSSNPSGNQYGFFSGFGSDLGEFALLGTLIAVFKHHNCAVKGCPRIGKHIVAGTSSKTCHKHATANHHNKLIEQHKADFPEQHDFLSTKGAETEVSVEPTPKPEPSDPTKVILKIRQ
jgi:hypothetical protein